MKTTFALLALSLSFATTSFAADLNLHIHSTITLKKIDKETYEKINEVSLMETAITLNGQTRTDEKKAVNESKLTYKIEKNLLKITDESAGVNTEMAISADRSIFGKLKGIKVSGESLENAYFESLSREGIIALRDLDNKKGQRKSLSIGDQVCSIDKSTDLMTCEQNIDLNVNNNGAVLTAALFIIQLDL